MRIEANDCFWNQKGISLLKYECICFFELLSKSIFFEVTNTNMQVISNLEVLVFIMSVQAFSKIDWVETLGSQVFSFRINKLWCRNIRRASWIYYRLTWKGWANCLPKRKPLHMPWLLPPSVVVITIRQTTLLRDLMLLCPTMLTNSEIFSPLNILVVSHVSQKWMFSCFKKFHLFSCFQMITQKVFKSAELIRPINHHFISAQEYAYKIALFQKI